MDRPLIGLALTVTLLIAPTLGGCGAMQQAQNAAQRQQMMNNLKMVGRAYHNCHDAMMRGPQNWQELQQYGVPAEVQTELQGQGYVVIWGVKIQDAVGGTTRFIVAYPGDAATAGGSMLFLDGSVQHLTAQEFNDTFAQQKIDSPKAMAGAADGRSAASPAESSETPAAPGPPGTPPGSY